MHAPLRITSGLCLRARNRLIGLDRYAEPRSYFGPGGLEEARALCAEANRDLLAFVGPPREVEARALRRDRGWTRGDGVCVEDWSFDSPLSSGVPTNDRVQFRLFRPPRAGDAAVLFHHPVYQRRWTLWSWLLARLIRRAPVAMMAAPYHFGRTGEGRFPGEGTINPNPARLFEALRQWCWDHEATVGVLEHICGLSVAAEIGYSLGAFQALLLASAGRINVPLVSLSSTNRYAYGLTHGMIGTGLLRSMRQAGIDQPLLEELTWSIQLELHVAPLRGRSVLYIRGIRDWVDPPPSLDRLEKALQPQRAVTLVAGHGSLALHRGRVMDEVMRFLRDTGALSAQA